MRGLGLAIVQDIVKIHNGHMAIDSPPDGGTTITLSFPDSRHDG
jgi:signal transduction histidine kinase